MRYEALATDFDGTLAERGTVETTTLAALQRFRESGRRLILITGRELDELLEVFPPVDRFDLVVAENGGLLYQPQSRKLELLGPSPPDAFVEMLKAQGVQPVSKGRVIVATWQPHAETVRSVIDSLHLDLEVILNKRAVMILPNGVNKASGLITALAALELSPEHVVGIGDAENDLDFLRICGRAVAVANALPSVKAQCHAVTTNGHGAGVIELIEDILA